MPIIVLLISFAYVIPFGILNENMWEMGAMWWSSSENSFHKVSPSVGMLILGFVSGNFLLSLKSIVNTFIYSNKGLRGIWVVVAMMFFTILLESWIFYSFTAHLEG